ncbi:hypothetical protein DFJ43DRAFT_1043433 [Lentinula guzmanii]|uniref:Uncharacterized protein n=1 Tax=Lentinula guzmanii TaxID=2804957 RepID=A0AA38MW91_9AGAR|nr:hypothetical protein DFJ43DRAFT_1043433 [Lentinula guzmanii]
MTRPEAESALETLYGDAVVDERWTPILNEITDLEPDSDMTPILSRIDAHLTQNSSQTPLNITTPPKDSRLQSAEKELMDHVQELRKRNRIHGQPFTVDEIIDPVEEAEIGEEEGRYGENAVEKIVKQVRYEQAVKNGEIIEVEDEDENEQDAPPDISLRDLVATCKTLQTQCLTRNLEDPKLAEQGMELMEQIRRFQGAVQKYSAKNAKQASLDEFFSCR